MKKILVVGLLLLCSSTFAASSAPSFLLNAGTQGFGAEIIQPLYPKVLSVSLQGNYLKHGYDFSKDNVDYDAHLKLATYGLLLNYHPFYGPFHLTGGGYYNKNTAHVNVTQDNSFPVSLYSGDADVSYKKFAPYTGLGWDWGHSFIFSVDLGVLFQGKPDISFTNNCTLLVCPPQVQQQQSDIKDKANDYQYYPVLRFGLGF